ncbi:MAG: SPOR domain-containing protein, partial [Burkholderiales bacterium]|nr:SPOR domain-containing protein [Burkholderiales bacterium]
MATNASLEASEIRRRGRRRLIGAVALVVLAVVFVPMILDSEPRPKPNEPSLEIPAKDKVPALPPPTTASSPPSPAAPSASVKAPPAAPPPSPAVSKAAATAPAAGPKLEGFAVQVGAFRDEDKLKQARDKLAAAGIAHYVERRASASGDLNRLRAGPFPT